MRAPDAGLRGLTDRLRLTRPVGSPPSPPASWAGAYLSGSVWAVGLAVIQQISWPGGFSSGVFIISLAVGFALYPPLIHWVSAHVWSRQMRAAARNERDK